MRTHIIKPEAQSLLLGRAYELGYRRDGEAHGTGAQPGAFYLFKALWLSHLSPQSPHTEEFLKKCFLSAVKSYSSIKKHTEFPLWRKAAG